MHSASHMPVSAGLVHCSKVFTVSLGFAFIFLCTVGAIFLLTCLPCHIEFFDLFCCISYGFWTLFALTLLAHSAPAYFILLLLSLQLVLFIISVIISSLIPFINCPFSLLYICIHMLWLLDDPSIPQHFLLLLLLTCSTVVIVLFYCAEAWISPLALQTDWNLSGIFPALYHLRFGHI